MRAIVETAAVLAILTGLALSGPAGDEAPVPGRSWTNPKDGMVLVWVPPGSLRIGCQPSERCAETMPEQERTFGRGFWIGRTEVTVAQFAAFVEATGYFTAAETSGSSITWRFPGFEQGPDHPVVGTSLQDALAYAEWAGVDIPARDEWEYAARAGRAGPYYWGNTFDSRHVWYRANTWGAQPVATKLPNRFGLYDVSGNAMEWTVWNPELGEGCSPDKGFGRGGSWAQCQPRYLVQTETAPFFRCFQLEGSEDDRGFRCIRRVTAEK